MPTLNRKFHSNRSVLKDKERRRNNAYNKYYRSFRKFRNEYIKENPLDELSLLIGVIEPATDVHHCYEFSKGKTEDEKYFYLLDTDNFLSLSERNHYLIHNDFNSFEQVQQEFVLNKIIKVKNKFSKSDFFRETFKP